jgi:hypothetical protein
MWDSGVTGVQPGAGAETTPTGRRSDAPSLTTLDLVGVRVGIANLEAACGGAAVRSSSGSSTLCPCTDRIGPEKATAVRMLAARDCVRRTILRRSSLFSGLSSSVLSCCFARLATRFDDGAFRKICTCTEGPARCFALPAWR